MPVLHSRAFPNVAAMLDHHGFEPLACDSNTAKEAAQFPNIQTDPFDRALVATDGSFSRTVRTRTG